MREILYRDAIREALDEEMARDERVLLIGEDIGFIGGNFKATVGLREKYGDMRVKDAPISEAGFTGMGVGMALTGLRPVVELMFSDFLLVAADQVVNQMGKIRYMSGGQAKAPMVIRCPIGGGRSSAAQHSQSMQAMVAHFPGIKVLVPSTAQEVKGLLKSAIRDDDPVVFFEHKMEYAKTFEIDDDVELIPIGKADIKRTGSDITIVATSSQVMASLRAAEKLAAEGISCEIVDLRSIVPLDRETIIASVRKTGRLLVVDEAYEFCGIGAEICANVLEDVFYDLVAPVGRIATPGVPLPFSPALEMPIIPSEEKIAEKVRDMIRKSAAAASRPGQGGVRATSLARRIAAARGVDLSAASGSGSFGKIVKADALSAPIGALYGAGQGTAADPAGGKRVARVVPYTGVRKIIGERLSGSMNAAPHIYFLQKADLSELLSQRENVNSKQGRKTSVTDYIARAAVMALQAFPQMNASLTSGGIEEYESVNIGIAVAAPGGLIVPVVKEAQGMGVLEFSKTSSILIDKAREGRLTPDEYTGGTFTVSNLGMFGIENFTAIINPPEAGILAVGAVNDEAVVTTAPDGSKGIAIRPTIGLTLSVDHRVVDGLLGAQFVAEVKRLLENPAELIGG